MPKTTTTTPIIDAINRNDEFALLELLKAGYDPNKIINGVSPLYFAITCEPHNINIIKILVDAGAELSKKMHFEGEGDISLYEIACESGFTSNDAFIVASNLKKNLLMVEAIKDRNFDITSSLIESAEHDDELMSAFKANPKILYYTAKFGYTIFLEKLLDLRFDIDARRGNGATALHIAVKESQIKVVDILLKNGANIELKANNVHSALEIAEYSLKKSVDSAEKSSKKAQESIDDDNTSFERMDSFVIKLKSRLEKVIDSKSIVEKINEKLKIEPQDQLNKPELKPKHKRIEEIKENGTDSANKWLQKNIGYRPPGASPLGRS